MLNGSVDKVNIVAIVNTFPDLGKTLRGQWEWFRLFDKPLLSLKISLFYPVRHCLILRAKKYLVKSGQITQKAEGGALSQNRWLTLLSSLDDLCLRFSLMSFVASLEWLCIKEGIGELAELVDIVSEASTELALCTWSPNWKIKITNFISWKKLSKQCVNRSNFCGAPIICIIKRKERVLNTSFDLYSSDLSYWSIQDDL